ncbi:hypothetical protein [Roseivirga sp.]|uniref:hypothetical protein n=1 Tax=Roseivirga sp. TaxID=1964215 RepID=UPI003B8BF597
MKLTLSSLLLLCAIHIVSAQNVYKSEKYGISFESSQILDEYETEAETVIGFENDDLAVDIEVFRYDRNRKKKLYAGGILPLAQSTAKMLGFIKVSGGTEIPNIDSAVYVLAYSEDDSEEVPVFVAYIIDEKNALVFEATVYCYDNDLKEGRKIAESFKLIN